VEASADFAVGVAFGEESDDVGARDATGSGHQTVTPTVRN